MRYCLRYSGTGFRPLKLEITLFPNGFRLKLSVRFGNTIVTSSIGDRTAILRGHEIHARAGLAVCRAKTIERLRFTFTAYGKRQTSVENFSE